MRPSARIPSGLTPNRLAAAVEARRAAGLGVVDLTETNPTSVGLDYPGDQILRALLTPEILRYDPRPEGHRPAREAVAGYYRHLGAEVDPGRIFLTASTSEAYAWVFKLLADPGDAVLAPRPSYPLLEHLTALEGIELIPYDLVRRDRWSVDRASVAAACSGRSRVLVVVHPNNPTGSFVTRSEADFLAAFCRERGLTLVVDEVFADYALTEDPRRRRTFAGFEGAPSICLSGLSKVAGLPQLKLGWLVLVGPTVEHRERMEWIADAYLSVGAAVQHATPALLALRGRIQASILRRLRANLAAIRRALAGSDASVLPVEGGWQAVVRLPRDADDELLALTLLEEDGVRVQPGYLYDFGEPVVVVSLITPEDRFGAGVARLAARTGGP